MSRPANLTLRLAKEEDDVYLKKWLLDPEISRWFPMLDEPEIEDSVKIWCSYNKLNCGLTALWNNEPCGTCVLYLQPFKKLAHQCLFAIIVDDEHRGKGVGTKLLEDLIDLAKNRFSIQLLHLEVYEGNPAIHLYQRFGFTEYGKQNHFIKEDHTYISKILMQKRL